MFSVKVSVHKDLPRPSSRRAATRIIDVKRREDERSTPARVHLQA